MESEEPVEVAVIGLGLMGCSFAAALRAAPEAWRVTGWDSDEAARSAAEAAGFVDRLAPSLGEAIEAGNLIVLAAPVRAIVEHLDEVGARARPGSVVLDLGSTKRVVVEAMARLPTHLGAVGGHPMCGRRTSGVSGASAELYRGRTFVLVRTPRTGEAALRVVRRALATLGASEVLLDADAHDATVAIISHLPHFLSLPVLASAAEAADRLPVWTLAAGGFRGATEASVDNLPMWVDIALTNGDEIASALRRCAKAATMLADALQGQDPEEVRAAIESGARLYAEKLEG